MGFSSEAKLAAVVAVFSMFGSLFLVKQDTKSMDNMSAKREKKAFTVQTNKQLKDLLHQMKGVFLTHMHEIISHHASLNIDLMEGPDHSDKMAVTWPFTFKDELGNIHEKLHGGIAAYLVDTITSVHLALMDGRQQHVSMHLALNYIKPVPLKEEVRVVTRINGIGRSAAFLEAEFWSLDKKTLYLTATHSKMFIGTDRANNVSKL